MPNEKNQQQVQIKLSDEILQGKYSNQMVVRHTAEEFVVDFFNYIPGDPQAAVVARVILSPAHLKRIIGTLQDNLKKFETHIGEIQVNSGKQVPADTDSTSEHSYGFDTNKAE